MYTAKVGIAPNRFFAQINPWVAKRRRTKQSSRPLRFEEVFPLGNRQDERAAGPTAATAYISRVPAGSVDRHTGGSGRGDHSGINRDLQLRTACDQSVQIGSVEDHNGGRNKLSAIHIENKVLLHFSQRNRAGRKGSNDRGWPSASA
jgi:hypothetical protein